MGLPGSPRVTARGVFFFGNVTVAARVTAIPHFLHGRDPGAVSGFRTYLEVLEASGVRLHVAEFKRKTLTCPHCGREIERWEEKETDVSLGVTAVELLHLRACDTLAIVSRGHRPRPCDPSCQTPLSGVAGMRGLSVRPFQRRASADCPLLLSDPGCPVR
jgi:hypothetical protein